jgi:predicted NUDIX family NTP pyrophosphohydrolase
MGRARSAGVILYRRGARGVEVLLVHPGGPFWVRRDDGAWSIPKGEFDADEMAEAAARREFEEETGVALTAPLEPLPPIVQSRAKTVHAFAAEGDLDPAAIRSNTFSLEWPPKSGRIQEFPEIDRAGWFALDDARTKIVAGQRAILEALVERLGD